MSRLSGQSSAINHQQLEIQSMEDVDWEIPGGPVHCRCGLIAPIWEAWKEGTPNPGRRFMGCSRFKEKKNGLYCGFFKWCDPPFTDRSRDVIIQLKDKLERSNEKVEGLKHKIKKMEHGEVTEEKCEKESNQDEDLLMLQREVRKLKKQIAKKSLMEKKLWIALFMSWLILLVVLKSKI